MKRFLAIIILVLLASPAAAQVPSGAAVTGTEGGLVALILIRNDDNSVDCFYVVRSSDRVEEKIAAPNFCTNNSTVVAAFAKTAIEAYQATPIVDPTLQRMQADLEAAGYTVTAP